MARKPDPLEAVKLKIKRAHKDIRDVDVGVHNHCFGKPYVFVPKADPDGAHEFLEIRYTLDLPDDIAADTTNAIHNLRVALDNLAWAVANRSGSPANPKAVKFPIYESRKALKAPVRKPEIAKFGPDWKEFIEKLKPYPGGNDFLCTLHGLDITDKHKDFIPVGGLTGGDGMSIQNLSTDIPGEIRFDAFGLNCELDDGAKIMTYPIGHKPEIEIAFDVAFRNVEIFKGQPVVSALEQSSTSSPELRTRLTRVSSESRPVTAASILSSGCL